MSEAFTDVTMNAPNSLRVQIEQRRAELDEALAELVALGLIAGS